MANDTTHIFRISLEPEVFREIEVPSNRSLYDLIEAMVGAFGLEIDYPRPSKGERRLKIAEMYPSVESQPPIVMEHRAGYRFYIDHLSYGERDPKQKYPRVLKAVGETPVPTCLRAGR